MFLSPGTRIGPHEVLGPLGAGGMGEVYLARDRRLDREVALKILPRRMTHDTEAIARFRREAFTLASLNHPSIATVYGFEETADGLMALVLERVEGETLAARLRRGRLPVEEALRIGAQIAEALEAAHERGVIHRDVKPGNVMIGPRGLVKVLDFGLARRTRGLDIRAAERGEAASPEEYDRAAAGSEDVTTGPLDDDPGQADSILDAPTRALAPPGSPFFPETPTGAVTVSGPGMTVGTPGYMSPEQVRARQLDERADIFAFGCVLYECLCGLRAFPGSDADQAMIAALDHTPDLSALPPATPATVRTLIEQCLRKKAADRLGSMRSARITIEEALGIRRASALREGEPYATPHNLPAPASSFVGRVDVLRECSRLLGATRLLTLSGMGGSGKTRIALRLARMQMESFPDGIWFVDLAPITEAGRVAEVASRALDIVDEPGRTPLESLTHQVGDRRMLFVIDNCEDVLDGAAALATALLNACPAARILATSREALGLEGEVVFAVPALEIPSAGDSDPVSLAGREAVQLFVDRATAVQPDFAITAEVAPAVAEICRRLDGIPLAIELAAARIRMLSVEEIRARLDDRFRLLARSGRGAPRQQTVRAVIQWSWDHLLPPEQDLMRRLAVFTGGWTLERATAVCSDRRDEFEMLDLLTRLVTRSLVVVQREAAGTPRYRFLESVWRFALEKLEAHPDHEIVRERHLAACLELAEASERALNGPGQARQVAELVPEEENLLAAIAWSARAADGARRGLRLAELVSRFWSVVGRYALGCRALEDALSREGANVPGPERALALLRVAGFRLVMGQHEAARHHLEECLAYHRSAGSRRGLAATLGGLSVVAMFQSRFDDALAYGEESLAIYRELREPRGAAMALHNLGTIAWVLSRPDHGRSHFEAALELLSESGDNTTEALCRSALASSLIRLGDVDGARQRLRECLARLEQLDAPREKVFALEALAELAFALGRPADAARLMGSAGAARVRLGLPHIPAEKAEIERFMARIAGTLGSEAADTAREAGRDLPPDRVLSEARPLLDAGSPPPDRVRP